MALLNWQSSSLTHRLKHAFFYLVRSSLSRFNKTRNPQAASTLLPTIIIVLFSMFSSTTTPTYYDRDSFTVVPLLEECVMCWMESHELMTDGSCQENGKCPNQESKRTIFGADPLQPHARTCKSKSSLLLNDTTRTTSARMHNRVSEFESAD